jgi:hypothetical protein
MHEVAERGVLDAKEMRVARALVRACVDSSRHVDDPAFFGKVVVFH